ncbi:CBS domain-containing protein [Pelagibacteraceae bacterium]|nr:CBS domain-containing protein [Pelagibacteraceae bacterium]
MNMPGKLVSRMSKRKCYTLTEADTVKTASQNLHEKKIGSMPVLDKNNNVIGIISERDLSQFIYSERFNINLPVTQIMTKKLVTCDLNTSVTELMNEMTEKKIRHILIIEDKKLLGIVSIGDVVNHLINKIKEENKNLKDYINSY